ncbi:MAG TPA: tetratricopeptide repeat protein [Hyalangium sp.]|jgi:tetratricopeptide (TPR) repeat protein|nr:tetratricopeptide repeat protein [Hyalangium sp.]
MAHGLSSSSQADIAILTVVPAELIAARDALGIPESARFKDEAGTVCYRGKVRSALTRRDYDVVLTCIGRAGNALSAAAVQDGIARYSPQAVLLVGIAAGVRDKVRIGDVVLSERVVAYEPAAVTREQEGGSRLEPRPEIRTPPHRMQQDIVHYRPDEARLRARFERLGGTFPSHATGEEALYQAHVATRLTAKVATVASGEKLLRDPDKLLEIRSLHGKTEVGEMEAAGLVEACERSQVPWLVVRGISDFGDEFKDDRFHEFASRAAAAVMADFLEHGLELPERRQGKRSWRGEAAAAAGMLLLALGIAGVRMLPRQGESSARICGDDLTAGLFKQPNATHFLVARFQGETGTEEGFAEVVSTQVEHVLNAYREEALSNPQEMDIAVPKDSLEIARADCVIDSHERAEAVARALDADVVLWGQAFRNPGERGYTVRPRATLYQTGRSIRRGSESFMDLASLGHLDLPTLRSTEPFLLVQFALGLHFYEAQNYWLAARFFEKSADLVLPKERGVTEATVALAVAYYHLPDLERSLRYSRQALETERGTGSALESGLLNNIGNVLQAQGDYTGALEHYRQALAITEKVLGKEHQRVADCLNNMGSALQARGDYEEALERFGQALAITEKALGKDHPKMGNRLNNIGRVLEARGDYTGALEHYRRALQISEKALGREHPDVAIRLNNIGNVLMAQGDLMGAMECYRRALAIDEKALGREHPDVAIRLNNIGTVLMAQGDLAGAMEHYRRALAIDEKALGKDHPTTRAIRSRLEAVLSR